MTDGFFDLFAEVERIAEIVVDIGEGTILGERPRVILDCSLGRTRVIVGISEANQCVQFVLAQF